MWRLLNVKDKLRVLQDVYPEAKRKAVQRENNLFSNRAIHEANGLFITVCKRVFLSLLLNYTTLLRQTYQTTDRSSLGKNKKGLTARATEKEDRGG